MVLAGGKKKYSERERERERERKSLYQCHVFH
jgi:hypothetical protein